VRFRFKVTTVTFNAADAASNGRVALSGAPGGGWIQGFGGYTPSASLQSRLQNGIKLITNRGYHVGFVMVDLYSGLGVAYNADGQFYSASTIKGPYVASLAALDGNALNLRRSQMYYAIKISDNASYAALRNSYGNGPILAWANRSNVRASAIDQLYDWYSARELALLWTSNYEYFFGGAYGSKEVSSWYNGTHMSEINRLLGSYYTVYSKPGWYPSSAYQVTNDAGIIWANGRPYIMAIMSNVPSNFSYLDNIIYALNDMHSEIAR
jgi:beta-lactamase class A